jgi:predicted tellurium resistance membrane protein TerC
MPDLFHWVSDPRAWIGLLTLTALEIVLGIDNIVFISILAGRLPEQQRDRARKTGLVLALVTRILLLLSISWIVSLTAPVFEIPFDFLKEEERVVSWRDMILIGGGLFLIWKSVKEIHHKFEGEHQTAAAVAAGFAAVVGQILLLDIIFSLDSVITAVGMVDQVGVMILAVIIAIGFMLVYSGKIAAFVEANPTIKMLALAFLVLIGTNLVAEGMGVEIPKGYTYFAMAFAVIVEMLNLRLRRQATHA